MFVVSGILPFTFSTAGRFTPVVSPFSESSPELLHARMAKHKPDMQMSFFICEIVNSMVEKAKPIPSHHRKWYST